MKEGWTYKKLGEVCHYHKDQGRFAGMQYIGMENIESATGKLLGTIPSEEVLSTSFRFNKGEVLYGRLRPYLRKVYVAEFDGCCSTEIFPIRSNVVDARIIKYWFLSEKVTNMINATSAGCRMPRGNMNEVKNFDFCFPEDKKEQQSIADYLDSAFAKIDAMKANAEKALGEAKALFQASLKEMLEPKEWWEKKTLPEISENLDSIRKPVTKGKRIAGIYPYYGASGIVDYVDDYLFDEDLLCISEDGANLLMRTYPIAFPISGKVWVNNHAHVLRFKSIDTQKYVEYYFSGLNLDAYITGAAQPKLTQKALNNIIINLPPTLDDQQQIVETLDSLKSKVDRLQANCDKISRECDALKQAILRQVFE